MKQIFRLALVVLVNLGITSFSYAQLPTPIHNYDLNGSLADSFAGPSLVNNGAALGASGLTFGANQGPSLSSWLGGAATSGNYSIEMYFSVDNTGGYRKLIDFQNLAVDSGLYNQSTSLNFYPVASGPGSTIQASVLTHLVLTRDGSNNQVVGYINGSGALGISFTDGTSLAVFSAGNNIIHFFQDDAATGGGESSSGFVDFIRIYDTSLTAQDASNLFSAIAAVPEPSTVILGAVGVAGMGMFLTKYYHRKRRMRRRQKAVVA